MNKDFMGKYVRKYEYILCGDSYTKVIEIFRLDCNRKSSNRKGRSIRGRIGLADTGIK